MFRILQSALCARALSVAAALTFTFAAVSSYADTIVYGKPLNDGSYDVFVYKDDGKLKSISNYNRKHEHQYTLVYLGDPNPEGDGTGGVLDPDAIKGALDMVKKHGSPYHVEADPWKNLLGHSNAPGDLGPTLIDPPKGDLYEEDSGGGGGTGGSFDPNVPLGEQLPSQPGKSDDDDDKGSRRPDPADAQDFEPDVIDPSPEPEADLFSEFISEAGDGNGANQQSQSGFVLLSPSVQGMGPGGANQSLNRMDPQPIPWATFGGNPGAFQRPGAVAGHGLR